MLFGEQEVGEEWADFDLCSLVGDSPASTTEVLLVDAHLFHDIIYPGVDLFYSMEVGSPVAAAVYKSVVAVCLRRIVSHPVFHSICVLT